MNIKPSINLASLFSAPNHSPQFCQGQLNKEVKLFLSKNFSFPGKWVFLNSSYYVYFFSHYKFLTAFLVFRSVILNLGCTSESTEAFKDNTIRKLQHIYTSFTNIMEHIIHRKHGICFACEGRDSVSAPQGGYCMALDILFTSSVFP